MIKLTLTPYTQPLTYVFQKNCVFIGKISGDGIMPDLSLPDGNLENSHIKIEYIKNNFVVYNLAEDPFATLNELPFGKKIIHSGDLLQIGQTVILFESEYAEEINDENTDSPFELKQENYQHAENNFQVFHEEIKHSTQDKSLEIETLFARLDILDSEMQSKQESCQEPKEEEEEEKESKQPNKTSELLSDEELESLLKKVSDFESELVNTEELDKAKEELTVEEEHPSKIEEITEKEEIEIPPLPTRRRSIKDDSPSDSEDETSTPKKNIFEFEQPKIQINWKATLSAIGAFLLLFGIVASCFFMASTYRNEEEEIKAAQAVADVAMALNFAQINHAQPQNQNWSDSEFLKHNLAAVLAYPYTPLADVDSHGNFLNTSYILRIYTGIDLNHFLIIAQPQPSLMQWLVPKAAITVDSSLMELRKISDLKTLNRLLINATLDNSNSKDIANFVQHGELIPLRELKKYHPHTGFDLPKYLPYLRPGAENLIYNGIRYYPLGESLMKKAVALLDSDDYLQDLPSLSEEISRFSRFPNIVLYSSEGIQMAEREQRALATLFPNYKFIHAYLQFNEQKFAVNSHLLMDHSSLVEAAENTALALNEKSVEHPVDETDQNPELENMLYLEEIDRLALFVLEQEKDNPTQTPLYSSSKDVDPQHPLYKKLLALIYSREQALQQIESEIEEEKKLSRWMSSPYIAELKEKYDRISNEQQEKIVKAITLLQQEYSKMPLKQFMDYVKSTGAKPFIQENLRKKLNDANHSPFPEELMNTSIEKIRQSTTLADLDKCLQETTKLLTLDNFPDPALFIGYQNIIHSTVLHRMNTFLLSPTAPIDLKELKEKNFNDIAQILQRAWVTDEDEFNYYLKEFESLAQGK